MADATTRPWPSAVADRFGDFEAFCGLLLSTFVFLIAIGIGGGYVLLLEWMGGSGSMRLALPARIAITTAYLALIICEVRSLGWLTHGLQVKRPRRVVALASSQRDRGTLANSIVAIWWAIHLAAILFVGAVLDYAFCKTDGGRSARAYGQYAGMFIVFVAAYMTSSFLVLAVGALSRRESTLSRVWRLRGLIDASLALGTVAIVRWQH